jgi:DpnII restriction endonuclease
MLYSSVGKSVQHNIFLPEEIMSILEELILVGEKLNQEASTIQMSTGVGPVGTNWSSKKLNEFRNKYYIWYANCLTTVPEDLKDTFCLAYESPGFIKNFLEFPIKQTSAIKPNTGWRGARGIRSQWRYPYETSFLKPFLTQKQILIKASRRPSEPKVQDSIEALAIIQRLARNFHKVVHQLGQRHDNRTPLITIQDEYDVQDIFHALMSPFFDDIRPEECCPSYAGGNSSHDFLLKAEQVIIEIKKTRNGLPLVC